MVARRARKCRGRHGGFGFARGDVENSRGRGKFFTRAAIWKSLAGCAVLPIFFVQG